jgi:hypothetical protein
MPITSFSCIILSFPENTYNRCCLPCSVASHFLKYDDRYLQMNYVRLFDLKVMG